MTQAKPVKDAPTVTSDWMKLESLIDGVVIKYVPPMEDERGEVCEVYRPSWEIHPDPLVFVYAVTIRPGRIKGWIVHRKQDDRIFLLRGSIRIALYDDRVDSHTSRRLNVFTVSERRRALVIFPRGVYHAIQNIGESEALFVNMPTAPYDHANPDKYRLPVKNDLIPFAFEDSAGW